MYSIISLLPDSLALVHLLTMLFAKLLLALIGANTFSAQHEIQLISTTVTAKIAEKKLSAKGLILVDDVFFHGDALNDTPSTEKGQGCKALLEHYNHVTHLSKYVLPINNGILLLKKL